MDLFSSEQVYGDVISGLRRIGYLDPLIEENYGFSDWFASRGQERKINAVAFGQTPVSYDSACIGVVNANGLRQSALIDSLRALGAPIILEIDHDEVREWAVSRNKQGHALLERYPHDRVKQLFENRGANWRPESLMRAKNIGAFDWAPQLSLFSGLLPELEDRIQENLDPVLKKALSETKIAYERSSGRRSDPTQLFQLVFWILTAKVFHDRGLSGFAAIKPDPDELLAAVAKQYRSDVPRLLNREARQAAAEGVWANLDFRNLSVEVLSQIWATTLVDEETKNRLGIHRTSRTIVRYLVSRIPFQQSGDDRRIVLEPCCGSGVFLVGAMNALRQNFFGMTPRDRHEYFVRHLAGIEKDPFGVEISRLALTLADFPNPGGWNIAHRDLFGSDVLSEYLPRAGVVLCNPPFADFDRKERREYSVRSTKKPVELLNRVLDHLHPSGVIGFVLPRNVVDGRGYAAIRRRLAERFADIDLTVLPDRAFEADPEVGLLVAKEPIPHGVSRVAFSRVDDDAASWKQFELTHKVSSDNRAEFDADEIADSLAIPEMPEVWSFLVNFPLLENEVLEIHRGIEWNRALTSDGEETGNRSVLVRSTPASGFWPGVPPKSRFDVFQKPATKFLSLREADARTSSYKKSWNSPKVIVNKSTRSRGRWRMAAFPDTEGLVCYQTFIAVWPKPRGYDEVVLSAILNSPVANAFVATREGKTDITIETIGHIPMPHFTEEQLAKLSSLITEYRRLVEREMLRNESNSLERMLMEIDAIVLDGYRMPPRLESQLLEFFRGQERATSHPFGDYLPSDSDVYFSLSDHLSPNFKAATSVELLKRLAAL